MVQRLDFWCMHWKRLSFILCWTASKLLYGQGLSLSDRSPVETGTAVLNATQFPGQDIFAQATAAFVACHWRCTVIIPPKATGQPYMASSTLAIPLGNLSAPALVMTNAHVIYTGEGYAIDTYETQPNPAEIRLRITDGWIDGTASGSGAFRFLPTSNIILSGTRISNFTNGDAVAVYGTEDVNVLGNYSFTNNKYGIRLQGIFCHQGRPQVNGKDDYSCTLHASVHNCTTSFKANEGVCAYAGNMLHVHDGALSNLVWDIYEEGPPGFEHLSNAYHDNELNGGGGGIFIEMGRADRINSNYFEAKSGRYIVLGNAKEQPIFYKATATSIDSNYVTTNGQPAIIVSNGDHTSITNNAELSGTPSACFMDSGIIQSTYFANNKVTSTSALCRNGRANAGATEAEIAQFSGDILDAFLLNFALREDDAGNLFLGGAPNKPSGPCTANGQWVHSQDGHLSVCLKGYWEQKL